MKLLCKKLESDLPNVLNLSLVHLMPMHKSILKKTADLLNEALNEHCHHDEFSQWFSAILDVIESKVYKPPPVKSKHKSPSNLCKIFFDNKVIEFINSEIMLHDPVFRFNVPIF